jgi:ribonucleotide monophosphatase NagD (HAD superfamily)
LNVESSRKETVLFGDELDSDILLGKNAGYFTVLVKTGVDKIVKGKIRPDLVLNSVADVKVSA